MAHSTHLSNVRNDSFPSDELDDRSDMDPEAPTMISPPAVQPPTARVLPHKRTTSGSFLSRLFFTRSADQDTSPTSPIESFPTADEDASDLSGQSKTEASEASKTHAVKQRKRKGSLRKVALLGGRKIAGEMRERTNSLMRSPAKAAPANVQIDEDGQSGQAQSGEKDVSPDVGIESQLDNSQPGLTAEQGQPRAKDAPVVTAMRISQLPTQAEHTGTDSQVVKQAEQSHGNLSSPSDPKSSNSYASTTEDDEEGLSFSRPSTSGTSMASSEATYPPPIPNVGATSYFPGPVKPSRPRSEHRVRPSPLQNALAPAPEPYSYAETEYWGWVILFVTWVSFTVGMGSCLDIWSWAWDVGETPYAPPELEDDPTLPIVGYYPALIVLTGVVAWVWITIAWIGMKYFRHAKIEV